MIANLRPPSCLPVAVGLLLLAFASTAHAQNRSRSAANEFGVELGGRPGLIGFDYERHVSERLALGVGVGSALLVATFPLYVSWTPVGDTHRVYLGAGATIFDGGGFAHTTETARMLTVGYEHRTKRGRIIRPTVSFPSCKDAPHYWVGFTFAQTF